MIAQTGAPQLNAPVLDRTGTLTPTEVQTLGDALFALQDATGAQMAVLIVESTAPESIEEFSLRIAEAWRLGEHKIDNGVLLLVAKADRRLRIEVGYGLEGAIPDAVAKQIIADQITPKFKSGEFADGIAAGIAAISNRIVQSGAQGEASSALSDNATPGEAPGFFMSLYYQIQGGLMGLYFGFGVGLVMTAVVFLMLSLGLSFLLGERGGVFAGAGAYVVFNLLFDWFAYDYFALGTQLIPGILFTAIAFWWVRTLRNLPKGGSGSSSSRGWSGSSSSSRSSSSSSSRSYSSSPSRSSSSGSSSSRSYSGGGGSFGGGGASGSW